MLSYCTTSIESDDFGIVNDDHVGDRTQMESVVYCSDNNMDDQSNEQLRALIKDQEEYIKRIRRQEDELQSYKNHMGCIEEDYNRIQQSLTIAEEYIRNCEKKISDREKTIDCLKLDLVSFYDGSKTENSFHESTNKLSFSGDMLEV